MKIVITGTPGTGKSTVAKRLGSWLQMPVVFLNDYAKKNELIIGKKDYSDVVDVARMKKLLDKEKDCIVEGHLACEFGLRGALALVLRCDPDVLRERMIHRGYGEDKIRDNLDCEALDYCSINAEKHYKRAFDVDTTNRSIDGTVRKCLDILDGKSGGDSIDFSGYLLKRF